MTPVSLFIILLFLHQTKCQTYCTGSCGGIPIRYPLGVDQGCGSPQLWGSFRCTEDQQLLFKTPSGEYRVQSIDYLDQTMVVYDPSLSTCNSNPTVSSSSSDFFLLETQYAAISPTAATFFVLYNCSDSSPLFNALAYVCSENISGGHTCGELFQQCRSFTDSRCCFTHYSTLHYRSMGNLMCYQYTVVYDVPEDSVPEQWPVGMKLSFSYPDMGCHDCIGSGGECGFDTTTMGFACICSVSVNTTTMCSSFAGFLGPSSRLAIFLALLFLVVI